MNTLDLNDPRSLLHAERLPGRLNAEQTAALLGFQAHDIPTLVRAKLLSPLGGPRLNSVKYFAAASVERDRLDVRWLERAARAVSRGRPAALPKRDLTAGEFSAAMTGGVA